MVAREIGDEMVQRLDLMTLNPKIILDLGCGTGEMSVKLQKRYPNAQILALDLSQTMIEYAKSYSSLSSCICADAQSLPLRNQTVDLIFANFLVPWTRYTEQLLCECRRVLNPDGLLMFTALGPDTLIEWRSIFAENAIPKQVDMHDFGDLLLKEGFLDPVLEVSHYTVTYRDREKLIKELYDSGMLAEPVSLDLINSAEDGTWSVTYEIVYAHAFGPTNLGQDTFLAQEGLVKVPLTHLRKTIVTKN